MSARSGSGRISRTRPTIETCLYQLSAIRTVSETRGSARIWPSRFRLASMFSSTSPSSVHSYQVAAVWSSPSGRIVATTHGFGCCSSSCSSDGGDPFGIRRGPYVTALEGAHVADEQDGERADDDQDA